MRVRVNGAEHVVRDGATLLALVRDMGLEGKRIAVERNGDIVPRSRLADTALAAGDVIEIVGAVGGG